VSNDDTVTSAPNSKEDHGKQNHMQRWILIRMKLVPANLSRCHTIHTKKINQMAEENAFFNLQPYHSICSRFSF
jgi:hypothetical protein